MKMAQTSRNKTFFNWMYEYQRGRNAAVPVNAKFILTLKLCTGYSNIPGFLTTLVSMPRYIMKSGWGPSFQVLPSNLICAGSREKPENYFIHGIFILCHGLLQFTNLSILAIRSTIYQIWNIIFSNGLGIFPCLYIIKTQLPSPLLSLLRLSDKVKMMVLHFVVFLRTKDITLRKYTEMLITISLFLFSSLK